MRFLITVYTELPADEARDELVAIFEEVEYKVVHLVSANEFKETASAD